MVTQEVERHLLGMVFRLNEDHIQSKEEKAVKKGSTIQEIVEITEMKGAVSKIVETKI